MLCCRWHPLKVRLELIRKNGTRYRVDTTKVPTTLPDDMYNYVLAALERITIEPVTYLVSHFVERMVCLESTEECSPARGEGQRNVLRAHK